AGGERGAGGLERVPGEGFVDLAGQPAHADGADSCLAVERGETAEEEREERVEALALDRVVARLLRELSRGACIASRGCVRLPLRVQARVRRCAVHRCSRDELAVRIRNEDRDGA